jgi:glycosyltransferase involved in cell wall biosynthesis
MISIITPTFNSSKTIKRNLESVVSQINCKNIQHIFVDNCSTDDTLSIISNYYSKNNIEFFIISKKDQGIYEAINKGLILAKYQVVHILNSDDYYYSPLIFDKILKIFNDKNID